jgi:type I restriction enzyme S subunit
MNPGLPSRPLGDLCQFLNGLWKGEKPPFVTVGVIRNTNFTKEGFLDDSDIAYLQVEAKKFEPRQLRIGDVILEKSGGGPKQPVGRVVLFDLNHKGEYSFSNFTSALRIIDPTVLDFRYLHRFLYWKYLSGTTAGMQTNSTGIRNLDTDAYKAIRVPVPKIEEQKRIVGILDKTFAAIATAKANTEQNIQNARALFDDYLHSVFSKPHKGWVEKSLAEAVERNCTLSYGIVQPGEEYASGLPIVRPTDLATKVIQLSGLKRIDPKLAQAYQRTALLGGELLLCVRGSTGVVSIASPELQGGNVTRGIVPIRFDGTLVKPDFGFHLMSSGPVQRQIREKTYGAALMQINIRDLRNIALRFPPLKEQEAISSKLDDLHKNTERLESIYKQKLATLQAFKQSLLHDAFTGAL